MHAGLLAYPWPTRRLCAQSPAAALLEILVTFEIDIQNLPVRYRLLKSKRPTT